MNAIYRVHKAVTPTGQTRQLAQKAAVSSRNVATVLMRSPPALRQWHAKKIRMATVCWPGGTPACMTSSPCTSSLIGAGGFAWPVGSVTWAAPWRYLSSSQGIRRGGSKETAGQAGAAHADVLEEIATANEKGRGVWNVRDTPDKGWGIYAESDIAKGSTIFRASCLEASTERGNHTVQTGWSMHVFMDLPARFINHSCDANAGIVDNEHGAFDFLALRDIKMGSEITWDYGASEFVSISVANCLCGSEKCRGKKISFRDSYDAIRGNYGIHYAKYLHEWKP